MSTASGKALLFARTEDTPRLTRKLGERGYDVTVASAQDRPDVHGYKIVCFGGCVMTPDQALAVIEYMRQLDDARNPGKFRLRRVV